MMVRNLSNEIVRRRLWPIPLLAVLVAIAAPVFFLKPSQPSASADAAASAAPGKLPARAARLLAAAGATTAAGRAAGTARDPFAPPSGHAAADSSASGASAPKDAAKPSDAGSGSGSGSGSAATPTTPAAGTTATTTTPTTPATTTHALTIDNAAVDVRFGAGAGGHVHRSVPRLQPYYIHGKLAAVFVKYSPSRHRAVFAVSPNLVIDGPVSCRRQAGICRYLDIPAGSYARLTMLTADRYPVTRRLGVVKIGFGGDRSATTATVANDRGATACLLEKLHAQKPGAAAIDRDACAS